MSERSGGSPAAPQPSPGYPSNFRPVILETFSGLETKTPRPGIQDTQLSICDGWIPLAPNALRTLWGIGTPIWSEGVISWFGFGNIGATRYCVILRNDGSVTAVNVETTTPTSIMAGGTILSPSTVFGFSQWGSQYLIFAAPQNNGYWLWDGTSLFTAGTAGPIVDITDGGSGYTVPPTVTAYGGTGSGITLTGQLDNEAVSLVTVNSPGSGYSLDDQVVLRFNGSGFNTAIYQATLTDGVITSVTLIDGGSGYQSGTGVQQPPTITVTDSGAGTGAVIAVNGMAGGVVTSLQIVSGGQNYSGPSLSFGGPGSGASAQAFVQNGVITGATPIDSGLGYQSTPTVTFVSATGAGATAKATLGTGGAVASVQITAGGAGYTGTVLLTFVGGNGPAAGTIEMMPFGISGTWVEVYSGHVWVGNGAAQASFPPRGRVVFSSGGSPVDFGDNGGAFLDTNSFARVGYYGGKQTNGFLYLIGDSSLDYISGVQTSTPSGGTTSTTTFNNQNADPQIGSPWPSSIQVFSRNIVYANSIGIYVSLGGAVTKVSKPIDAIYQSADLTSLSDVSSAVANIFGNQVYMLLLTVRDQVSGELVAKLLMWDGEKWFTSQQDTSLVYIATEEYNSIMQAWGTDGTNIFQLFAQPSAGFSKTAQSKLFAQPGYWEIKTGLALHGIIQNAEAGEQLVISVDNENGIGAGGAEATITGSPSPSSTVFNVFGPTPVGQSGYTLGLTLSTVAADMTVMSIMLTEQTFATNP